jgi:ribosomal protein L37AE/L43A
VGTNILWHACPSYGDSDMGRGLVHGGGWAVSWSSAEERSDFMVKRTCPSCGASNYSSCTVGTWQCHSCGGEIESRNESAEDYVKEARDEIQTNR